MRALPTATWAAAAVALGSTFSPAAPADVIAPPGVVTQPIQYGGPHGGNYPPYRRACNFGHHYTCVVEYSGYRRCGCQPDVIYSPNPYYDDGASVPVPGYDRY